MLLLSLLKNERPKNFRIVIQVYTFLCLKTIIGRGEGEGGSPIKGQVKRKNTSPLQKSFPFFAWLKPLHQHGLVFVPLRTRYFFSLWFWSNTDPHQSPIGIKAIIVL
jgi:hypothetical protein